MAPVVIVHRAQSLVDLPPVNYGVQLDVSHATGWPVLHDGPVSYRGDARGLSEWLSMDLQDRGLRPCYALCIHADGLEEPVFNVLNRHPDVLARTFVYGLSYPGLRAFRALDVPVAERISEEEAYQHGSLTVWVDRWNWTEDVTMQRGMAGGHPLNRIEIPSYGPGPGARRCRAYAQSPETRVGKAPIAWLQGVWGQFMRCQVSGISTTEPDACAAFLAREER